MLSLSPVLASAHKSHLCPLSLFVIGIRCKGSTTNSLPRSKMSLPRLPIVSQVSPQVLRVLGCNPNFMTLQGTNTYVVGMGQRRILIDTGSPNHPEYIKHLQETMVKYDFQLDHIIVTHWHVDHIGGVNNVLDMISNKNECKVWKYNPVGCKKRDYNFPLNFINDQQKFSVDGATLKIHHAPGHTADHIIITLEEDKSLFSGDCVLGEGTTVFDNLTEYLNTLQLILDLQPTVIFPGHGSVIKDPIVRVNNYIKHRLQRESEIYKLINNSPEKSLSEEDIVNKMYLNLSDHYKEVILYVTRKHLTKLLNEGIVQYITNEKKWKIEEK